LVRAEIVGLALLGIALLSNRFSNGGGDPFILSPSNFIKSATAQEEKVEGDFEETETVLMPQTPKIKLVAGSTRPRTRHEILALHSRSRRTTGGAFNFAQLQKLQFLGVPNAISVINKGTDPILKKVVGISLADLIKNFNLLARAKTV